MKVCTDKSFLDIILLKLEPFHLYVCTMYIMNVCMISIQDLIIFVEDDFDWDSFIKFDVGFKSFRSCWNDYYLSYTMFPVSNGSGSITINSLSNTWVDNSGHFAFIFEIFLSLAINVAVLPFNAAVDVIHLNNSWTGMRRMKLISTNCIFP